ncbi:MAG TPA: UDP-N-acetylglucosamine 2-epimerase, partial [Chitinophagaceae bacterium]|nr:UDP-N-acetylglucosamine 2-epimerase [Chitinophagaceae bacterium]
GLRSFNRSMPEEINRIVTDHLSALLFCSSQTGVDQLGREGISNNVFDVGDVMYDALLAFSRRENQMPQDADLPAGDFYLLTVHRPSNTDNPENLQAIFSALSAVNAQFVWPVHPRTKKALAEHSIHRPVNLVLTNPFSYFEMLEALKRCKKVLTDSGGVQKEAYWMKKPCITLREETEWVETLENDWNILAGPNTKKILDALNAPVDAGTWKHLYGNGHASEKIAEIILKNLYP